MKKIEGVRVGHVVVESPATGRKRYTAHAAHTDSQGCTLDLVEVAPGVVGVLMEKPGKPPLSWLFLQPAIIELVPEGVAMPIAPADNARDATRRAVAGMEPDGENLPAPKQSLPMPLPKRDVAPVVPDADGADAETAAAGEEDLPPPKQAPPPPRRRR